MHFISCARVARLTVLSLTLLLTNTSRAQVKGELSPLEGLKAIEGQMVALAGRASAATVGLRVGRTQGSGVIVGKKGLILTAAHVFDRPGQRVRILLNDGRRLKGITLGRQEDLDFGLIRIEDKGSWPSLSLGQSKKLAVGQIVFALGHPGGFLKGRSAPLRVGRVTSLRGNFFRTSCTINSGDSGGPVVDLAGRVVGIHSRIRPNAAANYHIPVDRYRESWARLLASEDWGRPRRRSERKRPQGPSLGIEAEDAGSKTGVRVLAVYPRMGAAAGGVQRGDIIFGLNEDKIEGLDQLIRFLAGKKAGETVILKVERAKKKLELGVELKRYSR